MEATTAAWAGLIIGLFNTVLHAGAFMSRSTSVQCFGRSGQPLVNYESRTEARTASQQPERPGQGTLERLRRVMFRRSVNEASFEPPSPSKRKSVELPHVTIDVDIEKQ